MTEVHDHRPIPADLNAPVTHNSGNMRSTPAGGQVSNSQFEQPRDPRHGFVPKGDGK